MVKNAIKIYGRIKPVVKRKDVGYFIQEGSKEDTLFLQVRDRDCHEEQQYNKELSQFKFYKVFDQHIRQHELFTCVAKPIVDSVLQGYNGTVFAYGQTGSGKTFTITGGPDDFEDRGLIPRAIEYVFRKIATQSDGSLYTVCITYLQIYNEAAYDLLGHHQRMARLEDLPKLNLLDDTEGYLHIRNLSLHPVNSENEALNLLFLGDTNRAIAETPMNQASSRSHCMFTIHLSIRRTTWKSTRRAKLHFVDLAGSERVNKRGSRSAAGTDGRTVNEARHINLSLHYLEQVIIALAEAKRVHVPYRNCIITTMLRDSIGGNCLTSMVATLSLDHQHLPETLATCRFAQRVALVKNEAMLNEDRDPMQEVTVLKGEVKKLKDQIRLLTNDKNFMESHLSTTEESECRELVKAFLENSRGLELPMDLRKIEYCCFLLKEAVVEAQRGNGFSKHERGNAQQIEKCMQKLLQQRNNEIAILTELLRKERKRRMNSKSPKRKASPSGPKSSTEDYQKLIRQAGLSMNKHEKAALKKYAANPSHTNEVENLKTQLRVRHTTAKKIHDKIEENKARIVESRKMLAKLENGIPVNTNVASRQKQLHAELKGILETEQAKYCTNLSILRDLKNECDHLTHSLTQAEFRFLHNFQNWWASQGQASILPKHTPPQEIPQKLVENPRIQISLQSLNSTDYITEDINTERNMSRISTNSFDSPSLSPSQTVHRMSPIKVSARNLKTSQPQTTQNISSSVIACDTVSPTVNKIEFIHNESDSRISALKLQCLSRESLGEYFACTELSLHDIQSADTFEKHQSSSQKESNNLNVLFSSNLKGQSIANPIKDDFENWISHLGRNELPTYSTRRVSNDSGLNCHDFSDHTLSLSGETSFFSENYNSTGDYQKESGESQENLYQRNTNISPLARQLTSQVHIQYRSGENVESKDLYSLPTDTRTILNESPLIICTEGRTPPGSPPTERNKSETNSNIVQSNQNNVYTNSGFNEFYKTPFTNFFQHNELGKETKKQLAPDLCKQGTLSEPCYSMLFSANENRSHTPDLICKYLSSNVEDTSTQGTSLNFRIEQKLNSSFHTSEPYLHNSNNDTKIQEEEIGSSVTWNVQMLGKVNSGDNSILTSKQDLEKSHLSLKNIPLTGDKEVDEEIIAFYKAKQRALQKT